MGVYLVVKGGWKGRLPSWSWIYSVSHRDNSEQFSGKLFDSRFVSKYEMICIEPTSGRICGWVASRRQSRLKAVSFEVTGGLMLTPKNSKSRRRCDPVFTIWLTPTGKICIIQTCYQQQQAMHKILNKCTRLKLKTTSNQNWWKNSPCH